VSQTTIYPPAVVNLLPEAKTQRQIKPRLVILHTNGGKTTSTPDQLRAFLGRSDVNLECHFDIGFDGAQLDELIQRAAELPAKVTG